MLNAGAESEAMEQARTLIDLISRPYIVDGQMLHVGASIGITILSGQAVDADELMRKAAVALLHARQGAVTARSASIAMI
ncbi:putative signal transduction protein with EAL and GGDEF domain [Pseudorhizobium tarimense]|uniref:Signal transduction protein with EAL and GGDEF domain n=1 Tax=Pseudorhizobium tarimense TaxID=1079109 RepID=A0ABV2H9U2_9HYPH